MRALSGITLAAALAASVPGAAEAPSRWYDDNAVAHGESLYHQHCATCHGATGAGDMRWRERDGHGKLRPPPLNGTGHAWHHPVRVLMQVILHGSPAGGTMPAWRDTLSEDDAAAVIAYFQAWWPDDVYAAWLDIEKRSRND